MRIQKGKVVLLFVVAFVLAIWFYPRPLTKCIGLEQFDSKIEATLVRPTPIQQEDGSTVYEHIKVELETESDSAVAQELYNVMSDIRAIRRWRLPFEHVIVYSTANDSVSLSFQVDGETVYLSLLSDTHTIYDIGFKNRQFYVNDNTFERLAGIVEKYGNFIEEEK